MLFSVNWSGFYSSWRCEDIFIHSGDVAKVGSESELGDFNDWLGTIKHKYQHMLVIAGILARENHFHLARDWHLFLGGSLGPEGLVVQKKQEVLIFFMKFEYRTWMLA